MVAYGWTLEYALSLTWPQTMMFYRLNQEYPTAHLVAAGLVRGMTKGKGKTEGENLNRFTASGGSVRSILPSEVQRYASDFLKTGG